MTDPRPNMGPEPESSREASAVMVLSVTSSALEDRIAACHGPAVAVAMPSVNAATRRAAESPHRLHAVEDWNSLDEMLRLARTIDADTRLATVVPAVEPAVVPAAFLRTMLGAEGGISYETAVRCTDKHRMKSTLAAAGLPVAPHRLAHSAAEIVGHAAALGGYPLIVKPRSGFGAINTHILRCEADILALAHAGVFDDGVDNHLASSLVGTGVGSGLAARAEGFLVERYLDVAVEYHCELLRVDGHTVYAIPGQYMTPLISDDATLGAIFLDAESATGRFVRQLAEDAVAALGIDNGFAHVELLKDTTGRWVIGEAGARRGGAALPAAMQLAYGIDSLALDAGLATGQTPTPTLTPHPDVVGWSGVRIRHTGRITEIACRDDIVAAPEVLDAHILVERGQHISPGGSGLFAGYVFYRGDTPAQVLAAMRTTAQRLNLTIATA